MADKLARQPCTENLISTVRSSLHNVRKLLASGLQNDDTRVQLRQLEILEQLLLDQDARLDAINRVLEEFNYSVAHELCAPLRRISGFTREVRLRCGDILQPDGMDCLEKILESSQQMNELIDALMQISRLSHAELQRVPLNLSLMATEIVDEWKAFQTDRAALCIIQPQLAATGDAQLMKLALGKLFDNAWKYAAHMGPAIIEFGNKEYSDGQAFFVRDNGVGFDMSESCRLFHPFQRLHDPRQFPGNGIGLTTVKKIIDLHGGRIWAEGAPNQGATFYFTLESRHC